MDSSRRQFVKLLPVAAMATGAAITMGEQSVGAIEVKSDKRYVFKVPDDTTMDDFNTFRRVLKERGFSDSLVVSGAVEIYELQ